MFLEHSQKIKKKKQKILKTTKMCQNHALLILTKYTPIVFQFHKYTTHLPIIIIIIILNDFLGIHVASIGSLLTNIYSD